MTCIPLKNLAIHAYIYQTLGVPQVPFLLHLLAKTSCFCSCIPLMTLKLEPKKRASHLS